ncbi:hypothetical protein SM007_38445 [Streptomyces avermitilis]|uniref:Secreted protein n=2 Tax=Streptomyces avermitilis TaxID=33903 RepID=Q82QI5_STRAW|nr:MULTISPECIES: DUF998 domain-containing protein [Streptomyces]MYS96194.1 DUF998 domain-containing protein [Streptomyces sp. SID5469]OOV16391.1 hypothetical protein SM007_38445 [Streptomyces avermitilis]BAC68231.1 putative secreted protein [Streptomyces avermitilis MA-4680 = NBRC 14893]BBJ48040.1 hypothetical protein SAVMC3_06690 [Streptomyces avermitilis]GDY69597.1 hypothetical protein SAV14893_089900 [Streptomyces avermitilis]
MSKTLPPAARGMTPARAAPGLLAAAGITAGPLFLAAGLAQGLTRDGFDFTRNALSQLSLGAFGWIQITVFFLTGLLVIGGAIAIRQELRDGPGGTWAPRLLGAFGASFLLAGVFRADPGAGFPAGAPVGRVTSLSAHGTVHMLAGAGGYLALCAALLVLARHFTARRQPGWAMLARLVPVGVLAGFAASATTVAAFTAGAGLGLLGFSAVTARLTLPAEREQPCSAARSNRTTPITARQETSA